VDSIIDRTKQAVLRLGVRGLVIDPYNYIEMNNDKEHKGISDMLTAIVTFAKAHGIHVFFIAHPKAMIPNRDGLFPVPTGMHISGGPTWFAKADLGITVHRGETGTEIHCWKARLKWIGKQGMVYVDYDVPTGRYSDYTGSDNHTPMSKTTTRAHYLDDVDF
jgi:twinkle protein